MIYGGIFDYAEKKDRLSEIDAELAVGEIWVEDPDKAQRFGQEKARLEEIVRPIDASATTLDDSEELLAMAADEDDASVVDEMDGELNGVESHLKALEFQRMFSGEADANNAFVDIQAGSGGTEAQDWAEMLLRMYLRWCEHKGFTTEVTELSAGDVAGIGSADGLPAMHLAPKLQVQTVVIDGFDLVGGKAILSQPLRERVLCALARVRVRRVDDIVIRLTLGGLIGFGNESVPAVDPEFLAQPLAIMRRYS